MCIKGAKMNIAPIKNSSKRATNISLSVEVYNEAKALGINLSQTCELFLKEAIEQEKSRIWAEKHAEFIGAYNDVIESEGLPLSQWRSF